MQSANIFTFVVFLPFHVFKDQLAEHFDVTEGEVQKQVVAKSHQSIDLGMSIF